MRRAGCLLHRGKTTRARHALQLRHRPDARWSRLPYHRPRTTTRTADLSSRNENKRITGVTPGRPPMRPVVPCDIAVPDGANSRAKTSSASLFRVTHADLEHDFARFGDTCVGAVGVFGADDFDRGLGEIAVTLGSLARRCARATIASLAGVLAARPRSHRSSAYRASGSRHRTSRRPCSLSTARGLWHPSSRPDRRRPVRSSRRSSRR